MNPALFVRLVSLSRPFLPLRRHYDENSRLIPAAQFADQARSMSQSAGIPNVVRHLNAWQTGLVAGLVAVSSALAGRVMARTGPRRPMNAGGRCGYRVHHARVHRRRDGRRAGRGGAASAVFNTARQVGSALGVALAGTLMSGNFLPGLHVTALAGAVAFLVGAFVTVVFVGKSRTAVT
jgi:DHA2 family methylenomycin A resistance protein-like MFS transporter